MLYMQIINNKQISYFFMGSIRINMNCKMLIIKKKICQIEKDLTFKDS